jgi:hypothetical protein
MADMATLAGLVWHRHRDLLRLRHPPQQPRPAAARLDEHTSRARCGSPSASRTRIYAVLELQLLSPNPRAGLLDANPTSASVRLRNVSVFA